MMIVTEEQAIKMYCPNKVAGYDTCGASQCMAWRWWDGAITLDDETGAMIPNTHRTGYCGLAGKPHYWKSDLDTRPAGECTPGTGER